MEYDDLFTEIQTVKPLIAETFETYELEMTGDVKFYYTSR